MTEYICRDDALLHSEIIRVYSKDYGNIDVVPVEYLADIPSADVQPVRRGRWIWDSNAPYREHGAYKCSNCDCHSDFKENYCYNCGVRMDGDPE